MPHISIKPEVLFHLYGFPITNSLLTSFIVFVLFIILATNYNNQAHKKDKNGFFYTVHFLFKYLYDLFHSIVGDKITVFFPLLGTFFIFILLQNWFGLLPGVGSFLIKIQEHGEEVMAPFFRGGSADLNTTFALGIIAVASIQYYGVKFLGFGDYIKKFITFKDPISSALGFLEIISEISRVLSFSFRLFGNVFAGEVLLVIIAFLVPIVVSFPFLLMEIFVGMVQALVFAMLTGVFLRIAITKHH